MLTKILDLVFLLISQTFIVVGCYFVFASSIGFLRMKNPFHKIHTISFSNIYGITSILIGLAIHTGLSATTFKILIIAILNIIVTLGVTHVVMRRAYADREDMGAEVRR